MTDHASHRTLLNTAQVAGDDAPDRECGRSPTTPNSAVSPTGGATDERAC